MIWHYICIIILDKNTLIKGYNGAYEYIYLY